MAFDRKYMERALELAKKGIGAVNPNPLVGAVIVKDDRIIGEGYHHKYGDLHAERDAFANLTEDAEGAEMYVTLEPCCHTGKQPPCVEAIIEHKIKRVYIGSDDPNPLVAGKGMFELRKHGIEVMPHFMKEECDAINSVFFYYITTGLPYTVMKYAMTADGKIATVDGNSKWISCEESRQMVHSWRNEFTGIMCGIGTVLADNPMLNCRMDGGRDPVRIICDSHLRIPLESNIVVTANKYKTVIATLESSKQSEKGKINALHSAGVTILYIPEAADGELSVPVLMKELGQLKIDSILLEGGSTLNWSILRDGFVNEVRTFIAPKIFGGASAPGPIGGDGISLVEDSPKLYADSMEKIGNDIYIRYIPVNE
ncbi:MAG: bifunctional diaminohydroxyphosphoribosylaminopyrimidine deaminase/5-amino-6-(5-phosphoribosylamino)uracil reductase RibD [Eubacterium sp.]|nr:bifunctional diaminohydroxyphosphoribosylaminopyrimidine deaminase/5-amino-6-(5-phosphoribosylamino)uracil reductase RibD [Eubacterium sp.]